jgi:2-C-methyl-D-erythritol 4-phosphate cytidylyltransferase
MGAIALVSVSGQGKRLDNAAVTALSPVGGVPLIVRAVGGVITSECVRHTVVIAPRESAGVLRSVLAESAITATVVAAGRDPIDSLRLGFDAALIEAADASAVLVHDAARALTPTSLICSVVAEVERGAVAVVPIIPVVDTVKRVDARNRVIATPPREALRMPQTPQGFRIDVLRAALETPGRGPTLLARLGVPLTAVDGHVDAMRIATPFDLAVAEALLARREQATHGRSASGKITP